MILTEKEKVLYDVAVRVYAALISKGDNDSLKYFATATASWNAAEAFYHAMADRMEVK
jgi:hypothetical protein